MIILKWLVACNLAGWLDFILEKDRLQFEAQKLNEINITSLFVVTTLLMAHRLPTLMDCDVQELRLTYHINWFYIIGLAWLEEKKARGVKFQRSWVEKKECLAAWVTAWRTRDATWLTIAANHKALHVLVFRFLWVEQTLDTFDRSGKKKTQIGIGIRRLLRHYFEPVYSVVVKPTEPGANVYSTLFPIRWWWRWWPDKAVSPNYY